ncbi:MAG: TlyA family RNA methyltransferase [Oscillospiraceae bacterium]|jgi:23S rRNA (cytidine1920-2'-O)/16S rRNA (cytidine1409-2'-O)-methyltransferase|nr:TlyA family RNA methyltransferase [Oscillospiraceae bacterium]
MKKLRLDQLIFDRGLTGSRERAKTSIMSGLVFVNGQRRDKPGMSVDETAQVELRGEAIPYVSRGGLKLERALRIFGLDPRGLACVDCGASTGGFTDVLLQNGAAKVFAVDVGYGQLAWKLRCDERVVNLERTNIRYVTPEMLGEAADLAVTDLSFISLKCVLPAVRALIKAGGYVVCLIKPQFEAGREKVGKKGVVREKATHVAVIRDFLSFVPGAGFTALGLGYSPVRGPEGNIEFLALLRKGGYEAPSLSPEAVVEAAHGALER